MIGIYKITSPDNKIYIGQSRNIAQRFAQYKGIKASKSQSGLHASFIAYGIANHSFEVLCECSLNELNTLERFYQEEFRVIDENIGLNRCYVNTDTKRLTYRRRPSRMKAKTGNYEILKALQKSGELVKLVKQNFINRSVLRKIDVYEYYNKFLETAEIRQDAMEATIAKFRLCRSIVFRIIKSLE